MKTFVERQLRKVFGAHAHDPDPARMSARERREAEAAMVKSGKGLRSDLVDNSEEARRAAKIVAETADPQMESELADGSAEAADQALLANETSGAYRRSDLADGSDTARQDAIESVAHEPPRADFVDDSDAAREAAARASETNSKQTPEEEAQQRG